jgi:hypothetical protein
MAPDEVDGRVFLRRLGPARSFAVGSGVVLAFLRGERWTNSKDGGGESNCG